MVESTFNTFIPEPFLYAYIDQEGHIPRVLVPGTPLSLNLAGDLSQINELKVAAKNYTAMTGRTLRLVEYSSPVVLYDAQRKERGL